jgi:hypothetical protein
MITQDLDDSYVFDRNQEGISKFYADVLFRHLVVRIAGRLRDVILGDQVNLAG